jgi:ABC-type dipeptide/oligopeptide/nickel transport system permease subunit
MRDGAGLVTTHWWLTVWPALASTIAMLTCNAFVEEVGEN